MRGTAARKQAVRRSGEQLVKRQVLLTHHSEADSSVTVRMLLQVRIALVVAHVILEQQHLQVTRVIVAFLAVAAAAELILASTVMDHVKLAGLVSNQTVTSASSDVKAKTSTIERHGRKGQHNE